MLSPLTKSESASAPPPRKWRLRRTLKRHFDYRPIETDDIKYIWAAYKKGELSAIGLAKEDMTPDEFRQTVERGIVENCHAAWTLIAETGKGFIPVGIVLAAWAPNASYLIVTGMAWLPWASKRNKVEAMVGFLNGVRKEFPLMFYALFEHLRMYEVCAKHGVVRRVGTSLNAIPGKQCAVFETISPKKRNA